MFESAYDVFSYDLVTRQSHNYLFNSVAVDGEVQQRPIRH